jgi:protein-disulfide isomerase
MGDIQHVRFLFDPTCPWAWRASRWVRAAAEVRPLEIEWDLLSLAYINRDKADDTRQEQGEQRKPLMRLLELARQEGTDAIDRLYTALGEAVHEDGQDPQNEATWEAALAIAGLDDDLLPQAHRLARLDAELAQRYDQAINAGAIGTPTLYFNGGDAPFYGPVIDAVPSGEDAGLLWDHLAWIAMQPYFYEFKRSRG